MTTVVRKFMWALVLKISNVAYFDSIFVRFMNSVLCFIQIHYTEKDCSSLQYHYLFSWQHITEIHILTNLQFPRAWGKILSFTNGCIESKGLLIQKGFVMQILQKQYLIQIQRYGKNLSKQLWQRLRLCWWYWHWNFYAKITYKWWAEK